MLLLGVSKPLAGGGGIYVPPASGLTLHLNNAGLYVPQYTYQDFDALTTPAVAENDVIGTWQEQATGKKYKTSAFKSVLKLGGPKPVAWFDGVNDYLYNEATGDDLITTTDYTVLARVIVHSVLTQDNRTWVGDVLVDMGGGWWGVQFNKDSASGPYYVVGRDAVGTRNAKNQIAITLDTPFVVLSKLEGGVTQSLQVNDGTPVVEPSSSPIGGGMTSQIWIAAMGGNVRNANFSLADLYIWNRALTTQECTDGIAALMNGWV